MTRAKHSLGWPWFDTIRSTLTFMPMAVMAGQGDMRGDGIGGGGDGVGSGGGGGGDALTGAEVHWLTRMRQEEKLARDVYLVLHEKWGVSVFGNIASSEQRHTDAVEGLLDKYGITDPVTNEGGRGDFAESAFNVLYDDLVTRGLTSLEEAYRVGVDIEILDIGDLEDAIKESAHTDIDNVYGNLLRGSYHHLAAFESRL